MNKIYTVRRTEYGVTAEVDGHLLAPRNDLYNHSPHGFEFGYGGSGPAQLALAILADSLGDEAAIKLHNQFLDALVKRVPASLIWWAIPESAIDIWLKRS